MAISDMEIKKAIKIIENTFTDNCTIYKYEKIVENGITKTKEVEISNIKCRLCINNVIQPIQDGVYYSTNNKYVVMLPLDVDVSQNSVIEVTTQQGVIIKFKCGYSFKLRTYQQVSVIIYDGVI